MAEHSEVVEEPAVRDGWAAYGMVPESATAEDVPPGYKRTEVGVIPEDWQLFSLGEILKNVCNGAVYTPVRRDGLPITRIETIANGIIDRSKVGLAKPDIHLKGYLIEKGDILYSHINSVDHIGKVAVFSGDGSLYHGMNLLLLRPESYVYPYWLFFYLASEPARKWARATAKQAVSQASINTKELRKYIIPLPSQREQRAIATALSDADALIESLDRLIAKKRAIKQAAMQQLLTGQTRLPGFTGEWETKRLGDVASFHKGSGLSKADLLADGSDPCIHYGELFTRYGERITSVRNRTDRKAPCFRSFENDVLMPTSDVTPNGLATASCIEESNVILGGDILIIRPNGAEIDGTFLAYKIRMDHRQIMQLVSGTTVFHIYGRDMAEFTYKAPTTEEQQAIVSVLSDMDTEIEALEHRREKARQIKQGMMQQLLTGRVRLIEENREDAWHD